MKQRLILFIQAMHLSQGKFEKEVGLSNGYVNNISKGIGADKLQRIATQYPDLNTDWLMTGEGKMLKSNIKINNNRKGKKIDASNGGYVHIGDKNTSATAAPSKLKTYPLIPIDAVAGFSDVDIAGVRFEDCKQYYVPDFEALGVQYLIKVSGSSMYPKYSSGDILACKKVTDILFVQWGKVYVIDSSQGALVKRIFEDKENPEHIICVSDNNEKYPPFSMPKNDIRSLSVVVASLRFD